MKILITLLMGCLLIGCGVRTVPVSSTTSITQKTDSVSNKSEVTKDSTFYKETLTEKILPGATVGISLSRVQMDSLITALGNLPSSMPKAVYYQDPKLRAMLTIMLDSLGNFQFKCSAMEQKYYEREVEQKKFLSQLVSENKSLKKENTTLKSEVRIQKKTWWQGFKERIGSFGIFFLVFLVIVVVIGILSKFSLPIKFLKK